MEQLQKLIENKVGALQQSNTQQKGAKRQPQDQASMQDSILDASVPMVFEQNTKNAGSMARYRDDGFGGGSGMDNSAPNYTQINQNTFHNKLGQKNKSSGSKYSDNDGASH